MDDSLFMLLFSIVSDLGTGAWDELMSFNGPGLPKAKGFNERGLLTYSLFRIFFYFFILTRKNILVQIANSEYHNSSLNIRKDSPICSWSVFFDFVFTVNWNLQNL